jgi:hypothetical protein
MEATFVGVMPFDDGTDDGIGVTLADKPGHIELDPGVADDYGDILELNRHDVEVLIALLQAALALDAMRS